MKPMCRVLAVIALAQLATSAYATPTLPSVSTLRLDWQVVAHEQHGDDTITREQFRLINQGSRPFPTSGWWLYFNAIAGALAPVNDTTVTVERVTGTLYRLKARQPEAVKLAPGATLTLNLVQPEWLHKIDKGPQGPFLVFDQAPGKGLSLPHGDWSLPVESLPPDQAWPAQRYRINQSLAFANPDTLPPIFPPPRQADRLDGRLTWDGTVRLQASPTLTRARKLVSAWFPSRSASGRNAGHHTLPLVLELGQIDDISTPDAYELSLQAQGIRIRAATESGLLCGLQSLHQLMQQARAHSATGPMNLATWHLIDAPRFAYRGLTLDLARHFQSPATIRRLLDRMADLHLNVLHLHLADDEGWRLQIAALPELTRVGARRGYTDAPLTRLPPAYGSGPDMSSEPQFLSRRDFIALLQYADMRNIGIIPEIEMPGHARAAIVAMKARSGNLHRLGRADADVDRLDDPDDQSVFASAQGYTDNVIDPVRESSFHFIQTVVADVSSMYRTAGVPLQRIHVGADELPHGAWQQSPDCQRWLDAHPGSRFADLWDQFYQRVGKIVKQAGASVSGWEELGEANDAQTGIPTGAANPRFLNQSFQVTVWNTLDATARALPYRLANAGYDVILAPATRLYFDMSVDADPAEHGVDWASVTPLTEVFGWIPEDLDRTPPDAGPPAPRLTSTGAGHLVGLEAALFTETVADETRLDELVWPRLLGLAERAWVDSPSWADAPDTVRATLAFQRDLGRFLGQIGWQVLPTLDAEKHPPRYRIPPPGLQMRDGAVVANLELPGFTLRYTLDGSMPTTHSPVLEGPLLTRGRITVAAFNSRGRHGRAATLETP